MPSIADSTIAFLVGRGYSGSIQDMQYRYLLDIYIKQFGAPPYSLSVADLQNALGYTVEELIFIEDDILISLGDTINVSGNNNVDYQSGASGHNRSPSGTIGLSDIVGYQLDMALSDSVGITDPIDRLQGLMVPKEYLSQQSSSSLSSYTTSSWTPRNSPSRKVYLVVANLLNSAGISPTTIVGNSLTWTKINEIGSSNSNVMLSIWEAETAGGTTGTIAIGFAGVSQTAAAWKLIDAVGVKAVGAQGGGLKQVFVNTATASSTPSVSLNLTPTAGNIIMSFMVFNAANAQSMAVSGSWVMLGSALQDGSNPLQLGIEYKISSLTQSSGWTTSNSSFKALCITELEAA